MAGYIEGSCVQQDVHTGTERCAKSEGYTRGIILTDRSAYYPLNEEAFQAELLANVSVNSIKKMYPVTGILDNEITGGDVQTETVGFSGELPIGLNLYSETYRIEEGDCLLKQLMKFNKRPMRVFRIDNENYIYGTVVNRQAADGTNAEYFAGFSVVPYVYKSKPTGTAAGGTYLILYYTVNYESELLNLNGFPISDIPEGLVGLILQQNPTTGCIQVVAQCSKTDYTTLYGDEWTNSMFINESGTAATSAVFNAETGCLTITPAGSYRVAPASVLNAGGIYGADGINQFTPITTPTAP